MKKKYSLICVFPILFLIGSCNELFGDHPLGNNFSLLEGGRREDRIIVYCSGNNGEDCFGGIYVIPTYANHYTNGRYAEYVETAKSNNDWIVAISIQMASKKEKYWIINKDFDVENFNCNEINCDSIIQSHVIGPLNFIDFQKKIKKLNIGLSF